MRTHSDIPDLHRHVAFAHLAQVEGNGGHDVLRPLSRTEHIHESASCQSRIIVAELTSRIESRPKEV